VADFFSKRFGKNVWTTAHARKSMERRDIDDSTLEQVIEHGDIKRQGDNNLWIFRSVLIRLSPKPTTGSMLSVCVSLG
jgi:Domain of unknown function (DUF4258)